MMQAPTSATLLRIFIGEMDCFGGEPLFEAIVHQARKHKLTGATVLKGMLRFGADNHLHTAKLLRLSEGLPVVIEIVATPKN